MFAAGAHVGKPVDADGRRAGDYRNPNHDLRRMLQPGGATPLFDPLQCGIVVREFLRSAHAMPGDQQTSMSVAQRKLPGFEEVAIEREFLSPQEHTSLLEWAQERFSDGHLVPNPNGLHRYYRRYEEGDAGVPGVFWQIRRRAISHYSVSEYEDEPGYKCFLGCNTEGGFVQRHTDPSPPQKRHVRMNLMISKPTGGGVPIVGAEAIGVEERDMWCFFPTVMAHESTPVVGSRLRLVLSIGILVPSNPG
ncbi:MAG TPA: hypothetical protein VIY09_07470 [Rhizomicrobium sp.]